MATQVINIKQASVFFASTHTALNSAPDYTCQVNSAAIVANAKLQTVAATMCGGETQAAAASGYQIDMTFLQDWGVTDSLSQFLYDNDAERVFFRIVPTEAGIPSVPGAEGECWLVAGQYLGDAGTPVQATVTFPCVAKPTISGTISLAAQQQAQQAATEQQAQPGTPQPGTPQPQPAGV